MWVSCSIFSDRSAAGFAIEQRGDTGGWNGTTEQVALSFCATIEHQIDELAFVFDSLGRGRQTKPFSKADYSTNDHPAVSAVVEMRHEAAIDLDLVRRNESSWLSVA